MQHHASLLYLWAHPTLATTEPSGLLQDTARSATRSCRIKKVQNTQAKTNQMTPNQHCQKQVSPPFSGKGLAQPCFLFSSFPLSHFVSNCLCRAQLEIYTCYHTVHLVWYISHSTFFSVHTQLFYHCCGCFFGSVPLFLLSRLELSSVPVRLYILLFNFSFTESLFSSWLP